MPRTPKSIGKTQKQHKKRITPTTPEELILIETNERLINAGGLALAGRLLHKTDLKMRLRGVGESKNYTHHNYECVVGYLGLLIQGKPTTPTWRKWSLTLRIIAPC